MDLRVLYISAIAVALLCLGGLLIARHLRRRSSSVIYRIHDLLRCDELKPAPRSVGGAESREYPCALQNKYVRADLRGEQTRICVSLQPERLDIMSIKSLDGKFCVDVSFRAGMFGWTFESSRGIGGTNGRHNGWQPNRGERRQLVRIFHTLREAYGKLTRSEDKDAHYEHDMNARSA